VRFTATALPGVFVIDVEPVDDERGFFAHRGYSDFPLAEARP
jgi:dTDP-4-dehydrorhamnose 3,5-epimerase-like enzyme